MPYARGCGWSWLSGPVVERIDASEPIITHGSARIFHIFSSLIPKKMPPVNSSSVSMNRSAASSGCTFHASAAAISGWPANPAFSGCRVLPIHTPPQ